VGELGKLIELHNPPLVMISLKMFRGRQESLSMAGEGYLIALDFYRNRKLPEFLALIDQLVLETGAQPNLSKDSRIPKSVASQSLPNYARFKSRLHLFDPLRLYRSELTDRIGV
jgi:decaprenylphospho-beta-D-ribofuranose 2-oxidase